MVCNLIRPVKTIKYKISVAKNVKTSSTARFARSAFLQTVKFAIIAVELVPDTSVSIILS